MFWVSSSVVFVWVVFVFGVCFVWTLEDTWLFAFHLFSNNVRIADRPQDVLMTVRASSVHVAILQCVLVCCRCPFAISILMLTLRIIIPCLHRQIQEPLILLSFLPLQMIEISNSPIQFLEFLAIQHDTFRHFSLHTMHPFVHVQAFCR